MKSKETEEKRENSDQIDSSKAEPPNRLQRYTNTESLNRIGSESPGEIKMVNGGSKSPYRVEETKESKVERIFEVSKETQKQVSFVK